MKQNKYLAQTLIAAQSLQARYDKLNAAATQRIRNPIPMHKLVTACLAELPDPSAIARVEAEVKFSAFGREFVKKEMREVSASEIMSEETWAMETMSIQNIVALLQSQGFIANHDSVAKGLFQAQRKNNIRSIRFSDPDKKGKRGNSYCRYFIAK